MAENDGHPAEHQPGATGPAATDSPGQQQSPPVEDAAHGGAPLAPPGSATPKITRKRAGAFLAVAVVALTLGIVLYLANAPSVMSIDIEVGGSALNWPLPPGIDRALWWDFVLISGYGLALLLATTVATRLFWSERAKTLAKLGRGAAVVVIIADLLENLFLALAVRGDPGTAMSATQALFLNTAAAASTIKWSCLVPAAVVALVGLFVAVARLAVSLWGLWRRRKRGGDAPTLPLGPQTLVLPQPLEQDPPSPRVVVPAASKGAVGTCGSVGKDSGAGAVTEQVRQTRWAHAFNVPAIKDEELKGRKPTDEVVAFCLSGGGIRSGSVAMGVLQTMREELLKARYLVSISGGGYTAGAFAQILTDAGDEDFSHPENDGDTPGIPLHDPRGAFAAGSVELDHVRRHSSYIASDAAQMFVAVGVLVRGLIASLALAFLPAVALGVAAGWFYRYVPVAILPLLPHNTPVDSVAGLALTAKPGAGLNLLMPAFLAVGVVGLAALVVWLVQVGSYSSLGARWQWVNKWSSRGSVFATRIAVIVTVVAIGVPVLVWACGRLVSVLGGAGFGVGVSGSVATVLLTFLASLASLLWRKRKTIKDTVSGSASGGSRTVAVPNGLLQQLLVIASVAVLVLSWLVLFGVTTIGTATDLNLGHHRPSLLLAGLVVALVAFVGGFFDETSLSLHPFYRRRLASAFSTRAVTVPAERGGGTVAVPYHRRERTTLSTYARPAGGRREFPEFVFAAAANLTGEDRTPPGLTAVSFTMGADWVGGPDVGWVRTEDLEHLAPPRLKRDLTVQAAVAISGAAVASAMGRMSRWYQIVLALSGVRLGAWLPHPVFVDKMRQARDQQGKLTDWTLPGLPRVRRATYLLRELFNLHPYEERLLLVTDGGHYENLGIVEALRRRCTTIYCVDGGGDSPPTAPGLAQAMALAETELGVRIHLDRPFDSEPGGGQGLDPAAPLAALNAALSKSPVITGTFRYPAASGLPESARGGHLYVAKASLWPQMPYELLSYAAQHPVFPHDSTGDQWFDDGQFTAYTQLGRELGKQIRRVHDL